MKILLAIDDSPCSAAAVRANVLVGKAAPLILDCASRWKADLVILGTHGRRGIDRLVFGSVAEAVVRQAGCPVETVCTPAA